MITTLPALKLHYDERRTFSPLVILVFNINYEKLVIFYLIPKNINPLFIIYHKISLKYSFFYHFLTSSMVEKRVNQKIRESDSQTIRANVEKLKE
jgi:hypothetical protein